MKVRLMLSLCLLMCVAAQARASCRAPKYHLGHIWEDSQSVATVNVAIRTNDFAPNQLVCLAEALRSRYSNRKKISILIFDSSAAADNYNQPLVGDSIKRRVNWSLHEHAYYVFDAETLDDSIFLMPSGGSAEFQTKISLRANSVPPCTLEVNSRCVLEFDRILYPWEALREKVSGTVTLVGTITKGGEIKEVHLAQLETRQDEGEAVLSNAALRNLKSWRFEPAQTEQTLRISYSYVLASSLGTSAHTEVQFQLPESVLIEAK